MKIAFLNFNSGFVARGGETFVHELANHLAKDSSVIVFQAGPKLKANYHTEVVGRFKNREWLSRLPVTHFRRRLFLDRYKLMEAIFTLKLLPALYKFKPDIVMPLNSGWQALIITIYCRLTGSLMVIAGQSGPGWDDRWNLLMKPSLFVALTDYQSDWVKKAAIWKQAVVKIPNGVDVERFTPQGPKARVDLQKPIILMVAASTPDKRVEEGIRAVAGLKSGSLILLGKGPQDERHNNLGNKLLGSKRYLHLSVKHEDVPPYYRAADLFVMCSVSSEAFGIVYLEAMASGLGVVATDDRSRREIVDGAGVFVKNPKNTGEYSAAITKALKMELKDKALKQAQKFSWDKIAASYEKEFRNLLRH